VTEDSEVARSAHLSFVENARLGGASRPSEGNSIVPPNRYRTGYVATAEDGAAMAFASIKRQRWTLHYTPSPTANDIAARVDDTFKP
jgi:hypothetical protein